MRIVLCILLLSLYSCQSSSPSDREENKLSTLMKGDWLILYPDRTYGERQPKAAYISLYDSLVARTGLRLVRFNEDGTFIQPDSLDAGGRWAATPNNKIILEKGGKGLDDFKGDYVNYIDSVLTFVEYIQWKGETVEMNWHLKKMEDNKPAASLLKHSNNEWRIPPAKPEEAEELRERLSAMLEYYSDYCQLLSRESRIFVPARFIVPVDFYQHGMGLKSFDSTKAFARIFYNIKQAREGYYYLDNVFSRLAGKYPSGYDYIEEYGMFMKMMAVEMKKY